MHSLQDVRRVILTTTTVAKPATSGGEALATKGDEMNRNLANGYASVNGLKFPFWLGKPCDPKPNIRTQSYLMLCDLNGRGYCFVKAS